MVHFVIEQRQRTAYITQILHDPDCTAMTVLQLGCLNVHACPENFVRIFTVSYDEARMMTTFTSSPWQCLLECIRFEVSSMHCYSKSIFFN